MSASIRTIEGIGPQAVEIFEAAGFRTIQHLKDFNAQDRLLWSKIEERKASSGGVFPSSYWLRLMSRCINIIIRVRSAEACDFVPNEYMCPLSLDWFVDPVVVASGMSYSRMMIEEHLASSSTDPITREEIGGMPMYANIALRHAVEHYRAHFQRFRIML